MKLLHEEPRSYCDSLQIKMVLGQGKGVFTKQPFEKDKVILIFGGTITHFRDITDFTHHLQISPETYLSSSGSFDDYINHSCSPNCAVFFENEQLVLKTIKAIKKGEQLTFDYGTIIFNEPTTFGCACSSKKCRKVIGNFYTLPLEKQQDYLEKGIVPLLTRYSREQLGF